jgi:tetratricopeptide (TPR) repeat protein
VKQGSTALASLRPLEAVQVLAGLMDSHPELGAEMENLAAEAIAPPSRDQVEASVSKRLRGLGIDDLAELAGMHRGRYVQPWTAAGELIDGVVGPYLEDVRRLAGLGRVAEAHRVAVGVLAGQIFGDFDAGAYDDALGGRGWAEYRRLITQAWQKNPSGWHERYLMQELLRSARDVDALVAMYAAELLPSGYTHLMIAQEFDEVGRADEALEWAERGLREAAGSLDARLVDYLAARYQATGAFGKAVAARQNAFDIGRTLASYRALRDAAGKAGQWESVRECALQQLRSDAAASAAQSRAGFGWGEGPVWISALIDDGDVGAAWDAAAGVASDRQWLTLADLISSDRPTDALPVYLRAIEPLRFQTGDPVYQQVAALLSKIQYCHQQLGTAPGFAAYLAALRADQKRKRNLIKLLDQRGL